MRALKNCAAMLALMCYALCGTSVGQPITWPTESEWAALLVSGSYYYDQVDEAHPGQVDIVGDSTYSAAYWCFHAPESTLCFRLRLNDATSVSDQDVCIMLPKNWTGC